MKKILSILTLSMFSISTIPQINFTSTNPSKINNYPNQNDLMQDNIMKNEKKYLIEGFDDINLINKIQSELASIVHKDNKGYFIYQNDADNIFSLNLSNSDIASFNGLDFFPNLTKLNIANNKQSINLAELQLISRKIQILDISENKINDIDIIMYFFVLQELNVSSMKMAEDFIWDSLFLPLSGITTLTKLDLNHNENISDISLLSSLTNLIYLNLKKNNISDISVLSNLKNLTHLSLSLANNSDISVLSNLTNLVNLNLDSNNNPDISALSNLKNLTKLWLFQNNISDISALTNLTELWLSKNNISDISALSTLINLEMLDLFSNSIPNTDAAWAVLHKLPNYNSYWDNEAVRKSQKRA